MDVRGKLGLDMPSLTGPELLLIRACGNIRKFLQNGKLDTNETRLIKHVKSMSKSCFIHDGVLYKRRRNVLTRQVAETEAIIKHHRG